eukprot:g26493.t1
MSKVVAAARVSGLQIGLRASTAGETAQRPGTRWTSAFIRVLATRLGDLGSAADTHMRAGNTHIYVYTRGPSGLHAILND